MHTALKKQLILASVGCIVLTVMFGLLLSFAVNLSLQGLEKRPDLDILPSAEGESPTQPF